MICHYTTAPSPSLPLKVTGWDREKGETKRCCCRQRLWTAGLVVKIYTSHHTVMVTAKMLVNLKQQLLSHENGLLWMMLTSSAAHLPSPRTGNSTFSRRVMECSRSNHTASSFTAHRGFFIPTLAYVNYWVRWMHPEEHKHYLKFIHLRSTLLAFKGYERHPEKRRQIQDFSAPTVCYTAWDATETCAGVRERKMPCLF